MGLLLLVRPVAAMTESVLHSFTGPPDGSSPYAALVMDTKGNLYGTTTLGGTGFSGTVFKLDPTAEPSSNLTVLYSFPSADGSYPDGRTPHEVIRDPAGNLYGTTLGGGTSDNGTVFKLTTTVGKVKLTVLYRFTGSVDGRWPSAGVIRDKNGTLYGTTIYGGAYGFGTVFKLTTTGKVKLTVLHSFTGSDGANPYAALVMDTTGNLYGTTWTGGTGGNGTVFKLDPTVEPSSNLTVLHNFSYTDGSGLSAGVIRDPAGNLYGTTVQGGAYGFGTVFKLDLTTEPSSNLTVLHSFTGSVDGGWPYGGVIRDPAGNLYGTTALGGAYSNGTVFKLDLTTEPSSNLTVLQSFTGPPDGQNPRAGVIMDPAGNLYGTTVGGGIGDDWGPGTVFKLAP